MHNNNDNVNVRHAVFIVQIWLCYHFWLERLSNEVCVLHTFIFSISISFFLLLSRWYWMELNVVWFAILLNYELTGKITARTNGMSPFVCLPKYWQLLFHYVTWQFRNSGRVCVCVCVLIEVFIWCASDRQPPVVCERMSRVWALCTITNSRVNWFV